MQSVARAWCFTIHYEDDGKEEHKEALTRFSERADAGAFRYLVCQLEAGDEQQDGRVHLQGYVEFSRPLRGRGVQRVLGAGRPHVEARRGTRDQARAYCQKADTRVEGPWEYGLWGAGGQGARSDLRDIAAAVRDGSTLRDIAIEYPGQFIRYHSGIQKLQTLFQQESKLMRDPIDCELHWGRSGAGKSYHAFSNAEPDDTFVWTGGKWWDGYDGQSLVLCDDFADVGVERDMPKLSELLKICQGYRHTVQIKGGSVVLTNVKKIVFTSNIPLEQWYPGEPEERQVALKRRFTLIKHYAVLYNDSEQ